MHKGFYQFGFASATSDICLINIGLAGKRRVTLGSGTGHIYLPGRLSKWLYCPLPGHNERSNTPEAFQAYFGKRLVDRCDSPVDYQGLERLRIGQ